MAIKVESIDTLKKYFTGITRRANHHAPNISEVIYGLLGIIILKKDDNTFIEVRGSDDSKTGNILWVVINGVRYAFRYEHSNDTIEIRRNSYNGEIVLIINNDTTLNQVINVF